MCSPTFSLVVLSLPSHTPPPSHTPQPNPPTAAHLQLTAVTLQLFCLLPPPFQILTEHRALALDHGREAVGEAYRGSRGLSSSGLGMRYGELSTGGRGHAQGCRGGVGHRDSQASHLQGLNVLINPCSLFLQAGDGVFGTHQSTVDPTLEKSGRHV